MLLLFVFMGYERASSCACRDIHFRLTFACSLVRVQSVCGQRFVAAVQVFQRPCLETQHDYGSPRLPPVPVTSRQRTDPRCTDCSPLPGRGVHGVLPLELLRVGQRLLRRCAFRDIVRASVPVVRDLGATVLRWQLLRVPEEGRPTMPRRVRPCVIRRADAETGISGADEHDPTPDPGPIMVHAEPVLRPDRRHPAVRGRLHRAVLHPIVGVAQPGEARAPGLVPSQLHGVSGWRAQFYYVFGFLALVVLILVVTCSEISIVLVYFQLCSEVRADHRWNPAPSRLRRESARVRHLQLLVGPPGLTRGAAFTGLQLVVAVDADVGFLRPVPVPVRHLLLLDQGVPANSHAKQDATALAWMG